jgi:hypothetical protein
MTTVHYKFFFFCSIFTKGMFSWFNFGDPVDVQQSWSKRAVWFMLAAGVMFGAMGYALRPIQQVFDDLHDSQDSSSDDDSDTF